MFEGKTGGLALDFGRGVLVVNAPATQGASGALVTMGELKLNDLTLRCHPLTAQVLAVALDHNGQPSQTHGSADPIELTPDTLYCLLKR